MAQINIQRQQPTAIWWIIGIVALAVVLWLLFSWDAEPEITRLDGLVAPVASMFASDRPFA